MKKYIVRFVSLALFFTIFMPHVAIGMLEPRLEVGKDPILPPDVKRIIATNTLRLILNQTNYNPGILFEKQWREPKGIMETITFFGCKLEKAPLIDMIILLIENGANPHTTNNQGDDVLHLLMHAIIGFYGARGVGWLDRDLEEDEVHYLNTWELKIKFLAKHKINFNQKNQNDATIAHMLLAAALNLNLIKNILDTLIPLGLDMAIKDKNGKTPAELGKTRIQYLALDEEHRQVKLRNFNRIFFPKR